VYELARGLVSGDAAEAVRHARELVALERSTGLFSKDACRTPLTPSRA
jgi:hypothetical protein